ncbi:SH3-containing GRB2-like protein 3-interacting protein 1 [Phlyctochytrium bullatum]|nr:SH3-containing GRB2-like protein 3-interacting protein 1 [Phlyctochytrium bullatum]
MIEKFIVNQDYAAQLENEQRLIELDLSKISSSGEQCIVAKYKVLVEPSDHDQFAPLIFNVLWKNEPNYSSFLLAYFYNEDVKTRAPMQDISFLVGLQNANAVTTVQTKPTGLWNPDKQALLWKVSDINVNDNASEPIRLLARFETQDDLSAGQIAVKFTIPTLCSDIDVDVVDEDGYLLRNVNKLTVAGRYGTF